MKRFIISLLFAFILLLSFGTTTSAALLGSWKPSTHAVPSTGVEFAAADVAGSIAKLDALFTAYSQNPQGENLLGQITVASEELSMSLVSLNTAIREACVLYPEEQGFLQNAQDSLVSDALRPLADKGNVLFGESTFMVRYNTESFE